MFIVKRNQVIITALVIMIAVAGYLNYIDGKGMQPNQMLLNDEGEISALVPEGRESITTSTLSEGIEIGDALTMDDNPEIATEITSDIASVEDPNTDASIIELTTIEENSNPGEAVFVNGSIDSSYFIQAKLTREQSRAKQKEILTEMINNTNLEQAQKAECAEAMLEIQKRIEKETAAEAMIEAKGFKGVYVRIDDTTVDVVVNKEALSDAEIAQIEDIVKRKTGMNADSIRISTMKK